MHFVFWRGLLIKCDFVFGSISADLLLGTLQWWWQSASLHHKSLGPLDYHRDPHLSPGGGFLLRLFHGGFSHSEWEGPGKLVPGCELQEAPQETLEQVIAIASTMAARSHSPLPSLDLYLVWQHNQAWLPWKPHVAMDTFDGFHGYQLKIVSCFYRILLRARQLHIIRWSMLIDYIDRIRKGVPAK